MKTFRSYASTKIDQPSRRAIALKRPGATDVRIVRMQLRIARYAASRDIARCNDSAMEPRFLEKLASGWPFESDWHPLAVLIALYLIASSIAAPFDL
ncbi:hypothetical protein [Caballeronia sp. KNU42]